MSCYALSSGLPEPRVGSPADVDKSKLYLTFSRLDGKCSYQTRETLVPKSPNKVSKEIIPRVRTVIVPGESQGLFHLALIHNTLPFRLSPVFRMAVGYGDTEVARSNRVGEFDFLGEIP